MKNIETTAMRRNRKRPYRIHKRIVPKYKQTINSNIFKFIVL